LENGLFSACDSGANFSAASEVFEGGGDGRGFGGFIFLVMQGPPSHKGGGPQVKGGKAQKTNTAEFFQDKKKTLENLFSIGKFLTWLYYIRAGIGWIISKTTSNWTSGTPTHGYRRRVSRRLPPLWMRAPASGVR
jgi:hypothetical protein